MIVCPHCKAVAAFAVLHKSALDPAEDKFRCNICEKTFKRYDDTQFCTSCQRLAPTGATICHWCGEDLK